MSDIRITTEDDRIVLRTPYHPNLPARAKGIGGRFHGETKTWRFDVRDEERVRELARAIFGTDGTDAETVTVRLTADDGCDEGQSVWFCGREVITRVSRDDAVRLGKGVVLVAGHFQRSGGSRANPKIGDCSGVVLEVRDLPPAAIEEERYDWTVEVVDERTDLDALRAERERLVARLAEIDAALEAGD